MKFVLMLVVIYTNGGDHAVYTRHAETLEACQAGKDDMLKWAELAKQNRMLAEVEVIEDCIEVGE